MADRTQVRSQGVSDGAAVLSALHGAYERGWQPADLLHITRRSLSAPEARLAVWAILHDARLSHAPARASRAWCEQLTSIAAMPGVDTPAESGPLHRTALSYLWRHLPRLPAECAPPSRWPRRRAEAEQVWAARVDAQVAGRVRGLLAKAERSDYPEEAETLTAKAQELLSSHALGVAVTRAHTRGQLRIEVQSRRVHLDNPYLKEKAQLLSEIGRANGVRTVWFSKLAMATTVGTPLALAQVELLYASLSAQASRAMREASRHRTSPSSTAFRRAFLYGFAVRVGERLRQADRRASDSVMAEGRITVADALPTLARQSAAVDAELTLLFPAVREIRSRPIDSAGWFANPVAASHATLAGETRWSSEALISA
ncbi:MAG: DUF2786 domain-containing protein [Mycobacteriaceae bacterium]|nr:DUF2786 domain-containing protein [Mycobacteriaceae bacterium]